MNAGRSAVRLAVIGGLATIVLLRAGPALAQDPEPAPANAARAKPTFRASVEWLSAFRWLDPADTPVNPGNSVLALATAHLQTELRPNVRVQFGPRLELVLRPRALATLDRSAATGRTTTTARDTSANWTEAFVSWRPTDVVSFTYGLQNFQWGPAELVSPSNRLFHETGIFRDPLYYVRGRHLARVNVSFGRQWSVVALAELGANGEPAFRAGERFRRQAQAKVEFSSGRGGDYVGVVAGARDGGRGWFGEYGQVALTEGLSVYADVSHRRGSDAWAPVAGPGGVAFAQPDLDGDAWRSFGLGGLRYTFGSGVDARVEYLHQDSGWRRRDFDLALLALAAAPTSETVGRWTAPGLEFVGRALGLVSVRMPDIGRGDRVDLQGRYLRSFTDRSGVLFGFVTVDTTNALVLFASVALTHGAAPAEFSRFAKAAVSAGGVYTW